MFYDPMICKLVTHGATRDAALDKMRAALDAYVIAGVGHNIPFLRALTEHPRFISGAISTQFIGEEYPAGFSGVALQPADEVLLAAGAAVMAALREAGMGGAPPRDVVVTLGATEGAARGPAFSCAAMRAAGSDDWVVRVARGDAAPAAVALRNVRWSAADPVMFADVDGGDAARPSTATLRLQAAARLADGFALVFKGARVDAHVRSLAAAAAGAHMLPKVARDMSRALQSPMPGKLVSVAVKPGDAVEAGQELAVVEAMKMANVLRSPRKGVVKAVAAKAGDLLAVDQVILEFA